MTRAVDNPLLAEALDAHGGVERWRGLDGMSSTIITGGGLWGPKGVEIMPVAERDDPRLAFAGHGYDTPWDPLHLAYFNRYAMWTYHALPFVLAEPGYEVSDVAPVMQGGKTLRGLSVRFPEGVHSHTREQRFYFGENGLLARHDHSVDVWADTAAAHLVSEYVDFDGYRLPTRRRVHPRRADSSFDADAEIVTIDMSALGRGSALREGISEMGR